MSRTTTAAARCRREAGAGANRWVVLVVLCVSLALCIVVLGALWFGFFAPSA